MALQAWKRSLYPELIGTPSVNKSHSGKVSMMKVVNELPPSEEIVWQTFFVRLNDDGIKRPPSLSRITLRRNGVADILCECLIYQ